MILDKKGEIIRFIKNNRKPQTGDIMMKYGYGGYTRSILNTLKIDNIIDEKAFECGHCKYWVIKK